MSDCSVSGFLFSASASVCFCDIRSVDLCRASVSVFIVP